MKWSLGGSGACVCPAALTAKSALKAGTLKVIWLGPSINDLSDWRSFLVLLHNERFLGVRELRSFHAKPLVQPRMITVKNSNSEWSKYLVAEQPKSEAHFTEKRLLLPRLFL